MGDLTRQDMLDMAATAYEHAISTIYAMDGIFKKVTGADYDSALTIAQFDTILQGVLLSVACADGNFDPLEQEFIRAFTTHGDLLDFIRGDSDGQVDLTWEEVADLPQELKDKLIEILPGILDDQCRSFIVPLTTVDVSYSKYGNVETTPGDFLKSIEQDMIKIAGSLAFVDLEGTDDEMSAGVKMIFELEGKHWRYLLSDNKLGSGEDNG